jgi:hypothetical protein
MTTDQPSGGSKPHDDALLLRAIRAQLRSTYRDVLRQPLPESIENALRRLEAADAEDREKDPDSRCP